MKDYSKLIEIAREAQKNSYAPYSGFNVGASLLCADGTIITGCNVENASYGETICAERSAICTAISQGKREFVAMAIVGGKNMGTEDNVFPCGACRQVLGEFCTPDFDVVLLVQSKPKVFKLGKLLPNGFKL